MKRAVVIGAGSSGLPAIKSCLEEGIQVLCYELTSHVGGVWRFRDEVDEDTVSVFRSVYLNVSKEMMAYSDFQPPLEFPTYPKHFLWHQYLSSYCDHFGLRKHIRFNHKVLEVVKAEDYDSSGRWKVTVSDTLNGNKEKIEYFDFVLICTGHHVYPIIPDFPGLGAFGGRVMHSKEYKRPNPFSDQKVLLVGFGNSAVDIANDISSSSKQVFISARHKGWVIPRIIEGNKITDNELYRRSFQLRYRFLPTSWLLSKEEHLINNVFDHEFYGLKPMHSVAAQRPVLNDFLPLNLLNGGVVMKPGLKEFKKNGVIFEGENKVTQIDTVILATGFKAFFPYLKGMEHMDAYMDTVYKLVLPAKLKHHSLAFIGMVDPNLSTGVCSEMQARWVAGVFSRKVHLPPKTEMIKEAQNVQENLKKSMYEGFAQKTNINGPPYLDDLAFMLGVKPSLFKFLLTDPKLFRGLFFGPLVPYQYRVQGPHAWSGARDAILGAEERGTYLLKESRGRRNRMEEVSKSSFLMRVIICVIGAVLFFRYYHMFL